MNTIRLRCALTLILAATAPWAPARGSHSCADFAEDAALLMAARQSEFPMEQLIEHARGTPQEDLLIYMIEAAYREPVFTTTEEQERAIAGFRLSAHIACLRATDEGGS